MSLLDKIWREPVTLPPAPTLPSPLVAAERVEEEPTLFGWVNIQTKSKDHERRVTMFSEKPPELTAEQEKAFADAREAYASIVVPLMPAGAKLIFEISK